MKEEDEPAIRTCAERRLDALIIGAGVIGSSLAWQLARRGLEVLAVDPDLLGQYSSSERNAGGVRATWWQDVNIALCRASIDYYAGVAERVGFQQKGYLWMHGAQTWGEALSKIPLQNAHGLGIEVLLPEDLPERLPFVDRLDGIAGATFSPRDGLINPNLLKQHYREEAVGEGARFQDRAWVLETRREGEGFSARIGLFPRGAEEPEAVEPALTGGVPRPPETQVRVEARILVNAAGAWAARVAGLYGANVRTAAVRRQISLVGCREVDLRPHGMIVDSSGLYFHAEGENILAGYSNPEEPSGYNFAYDGEAFFEKEIWPRLFARSSRFERVRHLSGWAGLYEVTPDRSAVLGAVPGRPGIYESHGYSGRGVMQSYGAAVALAELIATGEYRTLDAAPLSSDRFERGATVHEALHI